jgi:predicted AAA-ATPase/PD-(D/E)XK nuclease superfamily protein
VTSVMQCEVLMKKKLPIGITNFKEIIEKDYYYIDKTLLIKELLDKGNKVTLLSRPRRFGKTINLSMLYYFFSNSENAHHLFANTAIAQNASSMTHQGKYSVIFLTFKDVKENTWDLAYRKICSLVSQLYQQHKSALTKSLSEDEKKYFQKIIEKTADSIDVSESLKRLSLFLSVHYQQRVIILLDEYDAPIQAAFNNGYYKEVVSFIRNLLSSCLKDNDALEFGVLTGILRTAKEGIFSGLNNLKVYTILQEPCSTYFGFTQQEVDRCLVDYNLTEKSHEIQKWYNGYQFAGITIYNPWSILNCVQEHGELVPYWSHTSDNALIKKLITHAPIHLQQQLEQVLHNKPVRQPLEDAFIYPTIESNETALWSLLVFSGYLTCAKQELVVGKYYGDLLIPNQEVRLIYEDLLKEMLTQALKTTTLRALYEALSTGNGSSFEEILQEYFLNSISAFDLPDNEPEKSYHLFVLGLLVTLQDTYEIVSNRESGYGRYDIMLVPKDIIKRGLIIEFKRTLPKETLEITATKALEQIHAKQYAQELKKRGIQTITAFGIAFKGKEVLLRQEEIL